MAMWFVTGAQDMTPMPVATPESTLNILKKKRMWLVEGPSDPRPMPLSTPTISPKKQFHPDPKKQKTQSLPQPSAVVDARPALASITNQKEVRLALIGATGLVGRACAQYLGANPELGFVVSHYIGSKGSAGRSMDEVATEKEGILQNHYGSDFWHPTVLSSQEEASVVTDVEALFKDGPGSVDIVLSFLAPRFGYLEDQLMDLGFRLVSISPHDRMHHPLVVPFVNGEGLAFGSLRCIKSPNCCSVGSSVALRPIVDTFDVKEVFITTFQTLSGRGDALYPPEKVVGNVYPIGFTEEKTEAYIAQEVARVYQDHPRATNLNKESIHVSAYRVYVQRNHLLDIKVRVGQSIPLASAQSMLTAVYSQVRYASDVKVVSEIGQPRPRSHDEPDRVIVGNFDVQDAAEGGSIIRVSVTVDNVTKGAFGNALDISKRIVLAECP